MNSRFASRNVQASVKFLLNHPVLTGTGEAMLKYFAPSYYD